MTLSPCPITLSHHPFRTDRQDVLKIDAHHADIRTVSNVSEAMHRLMDHVVGRVPGVTGALVASTDGFVLASRLPVSTQADAASVAAMSAAVLGLGNRLVQAVAPGPAQIAEFRSNQSQAYVFAIENAATLTILAEPDAERPQLIAVGREITTGLARLLRGTIDV
jgi:predicted regulator of Ras-like GTPase activity (Roadblock/LC7/MglB family)